MLMICHCQNSGFIFYNIAKKSSFSAVALTLGAVCRMGEKSTGDEFAYVYACVYKREMGK